MKKIATLALALSAAVLAAPASAQSFQKPEDAIKYRKSVMTLQAAHFGALEQIIHGPLPYPTQAAVLHAAVLAMISTLPWSAFAVAGSDKGETRAKPEVWTEQAKFKAASDKLQAETAKLAAAAKTGNLDNIKAAFGPTAGTCKACHDDFQKN